MIKNFNINTGRGDYNFAHIGKQEVYGGMDYTMNLDMRAVDDLIWLRQHRARMEKEANARAENPAVDSAYQQYQTVLNLVLDQI